MIKKVDSAADCQRRRTRGWKSFSFSPVERHFVGFISNAAGQLVGINVRLRYRYEVETSVVSIRVATRINRPS